MSTDLDDLTPDDLADLDDLRDLMARALDDVDVPVGRMHDRAAVDGRRLRRRRSALVGVGGLATAAAVAVFAVPLTGGDTTARDDGYAGGHNRAADSVPFVAKPGYWDMPVAEIASRLTDLLPQRVSLTSYERTNTDHAPGESDVVIGYLTGTLSGRTGPGSVEVMLTQLSDQAQRDGAVSQGETWGDQDLSCPPELSSPDIEVRTCATRSDASGRVVERELEMVDHGVTYREVKIVARGGVVYAATANSTQRKWTAPPSASRNPLTLDQLARIATSPVWTSWAPSGS
ncbi:hypothetical protein [Nocardioides sp. CER19]|uniref:hypothetical protein n=1 Tax=Nocardioides sp. CER19 TaxID=3038538 RepID=UPI00244747C3|nr:hypothetical protein [Nocardioides sp. CER19]MDH2415046.1 hypothetical protein [Nocardioides sp. CER19]